MARRTDGRSRHIGAFYCGKNDDRILLGRSALTSTYGAAASVVIFLIWIYYSSQILHFGAELPRAYAFKYGSRVKT
jgi:membrane protein